MIESVRFENVWDAIETPEEAARMKAQSALTTHAPQPIEENHWSPAEAAKRFHATPAKMDDLLERRIDRFTVDDPLEMVGALGLNVHVEIEAA